jgi:hypothetical protein
MLEAGEIAYPGASRYCHAQAGKTAFSVTKSFWLKY